jgi:hypothetical protein
VPYEAAERGLTVLLENGWDAALHTVPGGHMIDAD